MDLWFVIMELVMLLGSAFVFGALARRAGQSPILGYILAGVVIGPVMDNAVMVNQMSELGVSLLLFSIGLEFSFKELKKMGRFSFGGGSLQVAGTLFLAALILSAFVPVSMAICLGAFIALSSTTLVLGVLVDKAAMDSIQGRASLGILLFQDIAIVPLVLMISLLVPSAQETGLAMHVLKIVASVAGLVFVLYLILYLLVPVVLSSRVLFANRELTVLFAISVGLGATWAAHAIHISPALGAFVAGMLLGESPFATQIRSDIGSIRTIMVTLFFASVGMFAKPVWFLMHLHWILILAGLIFLFKAGIIFGVARLFGLDKRHALATGIVLGQVGEFSFVLAAAARDGGLLGPQAMDLVISIIILLMLATPYMVAWALPLSDRILGFFSKNKGFPASSDQWGRKETSSRVLVVGLGPSGCQVVETLAASDMKPVIIDINPKSRYYASGSDAEFHLGDASQEEVLAHAGISRVCLAVLTLPDPGVSMQVTRMIRRLRPDLTIIVRCRYNRHFQDLMAAGASLAVDEEITMGKSLADEIIRSLADESGTSLACRLSGKNMKLNPQDSGPHQANP